MNQVNSVIDNVPKAYSSTPEFRGTMLQERGKFQRHTISYTNAQARKLEDESYKTRVANDMNNMVEHAGDVAYVSGPGISVIEKSIRDNAARQFGDDPSLILESGVSVGEVVEAQVFAGVSESLTKTIQQQLISGRPDLAQQTLGVNIDRIGPADRIKIKNMIKKNTENTEDSTSLGLAEEAFRVSGGDRVLGSEYIIARSGGSLKVANKAISFFETKKNLRDKQKKDREEKTYGDLFDKVVAGQPLDQRAYLSLPPTGPNSREKLAETLNKTSSRGFVVTDQAAKSQITTELDRMSDSDVAAIDVQKQFGSKLSHKDLDQVKTQVDYAKRRVSEEGRKMQAWKPTVYKNAARIVGKNIGISNLKDEAKLEDLSMEIYGRIIHEKPTILAEELNRTLIRELNERTTFEKEEFRLFGANETVEDRRLPTDEDPAPPVRLSPERIRSFNKARRLQKKPDLTEAQLQLLATELQKRQ